MKLKHLFLALLIAGGAATAQTIAVNTNDITTGTRVIMTRNHRGSDINVDDSVAKSGLLFFSAGYQRSTVKGQQVSTYFIDLDMFHNNNKLGCINQFSEDVTLVLEDGSEIKCFQMSDTECGQEAYKAAFALSAKKASAGQNEDNFKKLQQQKIVRIKVKTSESLLDYKIKPKASDTMKAHFALIEKTLNASK
ncbi:hypothetical protein R1T16_12095 [Flavobacterium sp. DG1-102-2]|uniref:hypothetical protein n=1 Tax=Flavobacterium sp. DG1-102-2 TaxID=3081663 RepID=UPI00294986A5|nr:hypothetical protein [Flavobacterium sp. DG1-102-2]MDV6169167.1 hypothetical protein [Flavobacterium sp. DG1-102-2]